MKKKLSWIIAGGIAGVSFASLLWAADAPPPKPPHALDGSWRWTFTMPDGTTARPKLVLSVEDGKLTGTTSFRSDTEMPITNAVLKGDQLSFQVIRERDGQPIVTTYTGKWDSNAIKGKIQSNWAGKTQSYDWEALRGHHGVEGTWRWMVRFGRGEFPVRVELEQSGETVTGSMPAGGGRTRQKTPIQNGVFTNGVVYFEIERNRFGSDEKFITMYEGLQTGDTLTGWTSYTNFDGELTEDPWKAKRVD